MKLIRCPDCGKVLSPRFPVHDCKPRMDKDEAFTCVTISVKLQCDGRGMKRAEIQAKCARLAAVAVGKSKSRWASAVCEDIEEITDNRPHY